MAELDIIVAPMIPISRESAGSIACGRSGLPLLAICPAGHRRTVPFRLLKTSDDDRTSLYGRPFKCRTCGSRKVTLFAIQSQTELNEVRSELAGQKQRVEAPTTHRAHDPHEGFL